MAKVKLARKQYDVYLRDFNKHDRDGNGALEVRPISSILAGGRGAVPLDECAAGR